MDWNDEDFWMGEVVLLERAETISPWTTTLTQLPKWVAARRGDYWHIPRTGHSTPHGTRVSAWCGQSIGSRRSQPRFLEQQPPSHLCGTCVGRYEGARNTDPLIFTPRDDPWRLPHWCPSTTADERGRDCFACGERIHWRMGYPARHRPGEKFTERVGPCPDHGYRHAADRNGLIVCLRHVGWDWGTCDFPMTALPAHRPTV